MGRPKTDDTQDIQRLTTIFRPGGDMSFRKACRVVYDMVERTESFEIFCARLYHKREEEIVPLLEQMRQDEIPEMDDIGDAQEDEDEPETPGPVPTRGPKMTP